jgi:hypothetical protein
MLVLTQDCSPNNSVKSIAFKYSIGSHFYENPSLFIEKPETLISSALRNIPYTGTSTIVVTTLDDRN